MDYLDPVVRRQKVGRQAVHVRRAQKLARTNSGRVFFGYIGCPKQGCPALTANAGRITGHHNLRRAIGLRGLRGKVQKPHALQSNDDSIA